MTKPPVFAFVAAVLTVLGLCASAERAAGPAADGWKLVWGDEFDGDSIDPKKWAFDRGTGYENPATKVWVASWGNNELEFYTPRPENVFVKDGMLHLRAVKEDYKGRKYTSGRIKTHGLFSQKYGRFEYRAKLPTGQGVWPAIWLLPEKEKYGGWAASGEIDVVEARGQQPNKVLGTLHYGSGWPANTHAGKDFVFPDRGTIADFHVYALEWEPGEIRWYVDGQCCQTQNFWWSCSDRDGPNGVPPADESELNPWPAPFDQPYSLILNLAVGGQFLGNPDATTTFPAEMVVDYVRVYERENGYGPVKPRGAGKFPFTRP